MKVNLVTAEQLQIEFSNMVENIVNRLQPPPASLDDQEKMLSVKEVAGLLSVSPRSVVDYTKQGLLKSYRLGGSVRYKRTEVLQSWKAINHCSQAA